MVPWEIRWNILRSTLVTDTLSCAPEEFPFSNRIPLMTDVNIAMHLPGDLTRYGERVTRKGAAAVQTSILDEQKSE